MTISFYLKTVEETHVATFYNIPSNPFKVNEVVLLDIGHGVDEQFEKTFRLKSVRLVKEKKYIRVNATKDPQLTIEYHCDLVDD